MTMRDPNNLRNRYRRYREAMRGYGWGHMSIREWARYTAGRPTAYSAEPHHLNFMVTIGKGQ